MSSDPHSPLLCLVAAVARNGTIGRDNQLLWREPEDQRHFRRVTMGSPVLMGRKTWDSLPERFRPLPGRRNLVLSRDPNWHANGADTVASVEAALIASAGAPRVSVIGGAQVYALTLPRADELVLTEIDADLDGDIFFPAWERHRFTETSRERHTSASGVPYSFVTYKRIGGT
jgi:dihydrofolate reductase